VLFCCAPLRGLPERPCRRSSFFAGLLVSRTPKGRPLYWTEIAVLASLFGLVVLGLAVQDLSLLRVLASLGFIAGFVLILWLWEVTLRRQATARQDSSAGGWLSSLTVLVSLLAALAAIVWAIHCGIIR
jgi:hypothetical protein